MDSNFQVKITADLSDLQNRLKNVEASLKSLGSVADTSSKTISRSFETAALSVQKVGVDMNRARLATFAFGQVVRDAGFFSQSFGLGMLAISNNIPILIDQLVLLTGISAGLGSALSLVGSLVAAAATVFAYWAQGVQRDGGTVSGAINAMANDSQGALGRLVDYLNRPPASDMLASAVAGIEKSVDMISQILSVAVDLAIAVWDRFGSDISSVFNNFYELASNVLNNVVNIFVYAGSIIKGDFGGAFEAVLNIAKNVINSIISLIQSFVRISSTLLGTIVGFADPLKGQIIKNAGQELSLFGETLKFASSNAIQASFSFKEFFNGLFNADKQAGDAKKSVDSLSKSVADLNKVQSVGVTQQGNMPRTAGNVVNVNLRDAEIKKAADDLNLYMELKGQEMAAILNNGIVAAVGNSMFAIGEAFATGGNAAKAFGAGILSTISGILSQLADKLIAASLAGLLFSTAMKNLFDPKNWGLALAAGIALKVAAGAAGGFARNLSGGGGSIASGGQRSPMPSFGSIDTSMSNSIGMAGSSQPVLETRVSGNDLVILMNRSSNARNNYY